MNAVLLILAVIFIFFLCNYLYRKVKGIPDKSLKKFGVNSSLSGANTNKRVKKIGLSISKKYKKLTKNINKKYEK